MPAGLNSATGGSSGTSQIGGQPGYAPPQAPIVPPVNTWFPLVVLATKLEASSLEAQLDATGTAVRLRGTVKVIAGKTLEGGNTIATLPEGLRPGKTVTGIPFAVVGETPAFRDLTVTTTGELKTVAGTFGAGSVIGFDGISFPLSE